MKAATALEGLKVCSKLMALIKHCDGDMWRMDGAHCQQAGEWEV